MPGTKTRNKAPTNKIRFSMTSSTLPEHAIPHARIDEIMAADCDPPPLRNQADRLSIEVTVIVVLIFVVVIERLNSWGTKPGRS